MATQVLWLWAQRRCRACKCLTFDRLRWSIVWVFNKPCQKSSLQQWRRRAVSIYLKKLQWLHAQLRRGYITSPACQLHIAEQIRWRWVNASTQLKEAAKIPTWCLDSINPGDWSTSGPSLPDVPCPTNAYASQHKPLACARACARTCYWHISSYLPIHTPIMKFIGKKCK